MPVLRAIQYSGLVDVLVVVIREYGGIKLGSGGLMRAYGKAASSVLEAVPGIARVPERVLELTVSYAAIGAVQRLYAGYDAEAIQKTYAEQVCCVLRLPWSVSDAFLQAVTDATHGSVHVRDL
jgi:putative IMPACT (imprinted ancient) family translation regulator